MGETRRAVTADFARSCKMCGFEATDVRYPFVNDVVTSQSGSLVVAIAARSAAVFA
jgi:hypothetical protein